MDSSEMTTHSFVIRIWREETSAASQPAIWRGHIIHVPGGEQRYLQDLKAISDFIVPYLEEMRVRVSLRWRIWRWLRRRT